MQSIMLICKLAIMRATPHPDTQGLDHSISPESRVHPIAILGCEETPSEIDMLHADKMRPAKSGRRVVTLPPTPGEGIESARTKPLLVASGARTAQSDVSKRSHLPKRHHTLIQMAAEKKMNERSHLPKWHEWLHDRDPMTPVRMASARTLEAHP
jgi:hypothetical protein